MSYKEGANLAIQQFSESGFFISILNTKSCNLFRQTIIMGLLKMIRIREIAGRPIARQMFLRNFIEDLPIGGDESLQQSLIGVRVFPTITYRCKSYAQNCTSYCSKFKSIFRSYLHSFVCQNMLLLCMQISKHVGTCMIYIYNMSCHHICWGASLQTSLVGAFLALLVHTRYIVCAETSIPPPVYP